MNLTYLGQWGKYLGTLSLKPDRPRVSSWLSHSLAWYYRLNVCVPTSPTPTCYQIYMLEVDPQCDGIWRWDLWEIITS